MKKIVKFVQVQKNNKRRVKRVKKTRGINNDLQDEE